MDKPKGGRGKKADYESTHVRIPAPLKDRVEELKQLWFEGQLEFHDDCIARDARLAREYENLLTGKEEKHDSSLNPLPSLDTAINEAKKILKSKKSARESILKLLTTLYDVELTKQDLE
jgi:glutamate mutase epsilon subunit